MKAEFEEIKQGLAEELRASEGFKKRELLEPANRLRLAIAFGIFLGQQCTGMTALAYFGPQFFETLVGGGDQDLLITGLYGAEKFITCGIYIICFSETWNRKPTLWISALLMACCFVVVNVVNKTTPDPVDNNPTSAGIATVAMVFITNSIYQFSWGPLPWPYVAEVIVLTLQLCNHQYSLWLSDLSITHPRIWDRCRSFHTMAVQLHVLTHHPVCTLLRTVSVGDIC